jgi:hypothetical protein
MRRASENIGIVASAFFILLLSSLTAQAETINEVFQTVAYIQGKGEVERTPIDGVEYEIWLKKSSEAQPIPYRKPFSGTGFFVRKGNQIYLITAEHVAKSLRYDVKVTVHGPEDIPLTYDIKDLTGSGKEPSWFFHSEADVALLPLNPSEKFKGIIKVLEPNMFLINENGFGQYKNRVLTTIGFPLSLGLSGKFSPITKSSKAASNLFRYRRFDKAIETTFLVLDDPSVQGFSGAPVYALSEVSLGGVAFGTGQFACIGLVHGTLPDNTGGKFAAIVPSYFIIQTIEKFENKESDL